MDLAPLVLHRPAGVSFAALRLALAVPNVQFDIEQEMQLHDAVPEFKPRIMANLRTTLLEAIATVRKFGEGQKGVLESLRKIFADDKEITALLDAKLKALAPKR